MFVRRLRAVCATVSPDGHGSGSRSGCHALHLRRCGIVRDDRLVDGQAQRPGLLQAAVGCADSSVGCGRGGGARRRRQRDAAHVFKCQQRLHQRRGRRLQQQRQQCAAAHTRRCDPHGRCLGAAVQVQPYSAPPAQMLQHETKRHSMRGGRSLAEPKQLFQLFEAALWGFASNGRCQSPDAL